MRMLRVRHLRTFKTFGAIRGQASRMFGVRGGPVSVIHAGCSRKKSNFCGQGQHFGLGRHEKFMDFRHVRNSGAMECRT
jgi:hypothetical protein